MCRHTKITFACGHSEKTRKKCRYPTNDCVERVHDLHEGDCQQCEDDAEDDKFISRGRIGRPRNFQQLRHQDSAQHHEAPSPSLYNIQLSHWEAPSKYEKAWSSPIRQRADDGWDAEHAKRVRGLEGAALSASQSPESSRSSSQRSLGVESCNRSNWDEYSPHLQDRICRIQNTDQRSPKARHARSQRSGYDTYDDSSSFDEPLSFARKSKPSRVMPLDYDSGYASRSDPQLLHYRTPRPSIQRYNTSNFTDMRDTDWKRW